MEIKKIKEENNFLQIEVIGETSTFLNLLKEVLYEDKNVKSAAFADIHPLVKKPQILLRTEKGKPETALKEAAERVKKMAEDFEDKFKKAK